MSDNSSLQITEQAMVVLSHAVDNEQDSNLARSLVQCIGMGGTIGKESDTLLIVHTDIGMTIGLHYDGKKWSMHS
jgi:hypothetical protein